MELSVLARRAQASQVRAKMLNACVLWPPVSWSWAERKKNKEKKKYFRFLADFGRASLRHDNTQSKTDEMMMHLLLFCLFQAER